MRRLSLAFVAAATLIAPLGALSARAQMLPARSLPTPNSADLPVAAGQASYVNLGAPVRDIVVGDPAVADVSVVNDRTLVVLGKRPGVTSLLAFGPGGRALADRQIVVSENSGGGVTIYRGAVASNYACAAQCTRLGAAAAGAATAAPTVP
ncbi:pilus assembly protein N-terminal domain-containing protein [uncultured Caulobacter sp.]|uniref:pilus assembly protein N-terminal domain-containing protein n=1 Tax=uncultured Caulobacter sp. TaxID=158749 RepID=UPI0026144541|nr:pilus assembly protein N-terminal domain-containing protein [uncultured Caulobacter sp.]